MGVVVVEEAIAVLRAYVEGVNAGLSALAVKPPEYLVLRTQPRPWAVEDCALVIASMFLTLQDSEARRESRLAAVYATLPAPLAEAGPEHTRVVVFAPEEMLLIAGSQFTLFAMWFDMESNKDLR